MGKHPQWKMTSMEDKLKGGKPQWNTTSMEDNLNGRQPQWQTTSMEDGGPQLNRTSIEDDHH